MLRLMLAVLCCCASLSAADPVPFLVACEDQPLPPWSLADGTGIDPDLVRMIAPGLGLNVTITVLPWRRCLAQLADGSVDAVLNASFKSDRMAFGRYPLDAAGQPDASRALHEMTYVLYRRKGDTLGWDGKALIGLHGIIGAQSGFSIVDHLRALGATVEDDSKDPKVVLRKLSFGRLQGAALLREGAESILAADGDLQAAIEPVAPALESKPYHLLIGARFATAHPDLPDRIWDAVRTARATEAYRTALAEARR